MNSNYEFLKNHLEKLKGQNFEGLECADELKEIATLCQNHPNYAIAVLIVNSHLLACAPEMKVMSDLYYRIVHACLMSE